MTIHKTIKTLTLSLTALVLLFALKPGKATAQVSNTCFVSNMTLTNGNLGYHLTINMLTPSTQALTVNRIIRNNTNGIELQNITVPGMTACGQTSCTYNHSLDVNGLGIVDVQHIQDYSLFFSFPSGGGCSAPINIPVTPDTTDTTTDTNDGASFTLLDGPSSADLDSLNPLRTFGNPDLADSLSTPAGFISRFLLFAMPIAGLLMFLMLVWGGFEIVYGATGKKSLDAGKQRIKAAILGFVLLFSSYWIVKILEVVFGIKIF